MAAVDYTRFYRLVDRVKEVRVAPGAPPLVVIVYQRATEAPLARFSTAHVGVDDATTRLNQANDEIAKNIEAMKRYSNTALAVIAALLPQTKLPGPLTAQATDTDRRQMLQRLFTIITPHAGEDWADELLQGDFGTLGTLFIGYLNDAIQAANDLQAAKTERAASFEPAWQAFIAFRRVVRSQFGPKARQHRRLQVRKVESDEEDETPPEEGEESLPETDEDAEAAEGDTETAEPDTETAPASEAVASVQ